MSGWREFYTLLEEERRTLAELCAAADTMTTVLIAGDGESIAAADRVLEGRRMLHGTALERRIAMQRAGFGDATLSEVLAYAPLKARAKLRATVTEIEERRFALRLANDNNKALVFAGMQRLQRIARLIHHAGSERLGTYKRRGTVAPNDGSVLVSKKA